MKSRKLLWLFLLLALPVLACRLGSTPAVEIPEETIQVSAEEAEALKEEVRAVASQIAETGQAELQITEVQLTSYVALQLQEQGFTELTEPQIYLRSGQILVAGRYQDGLTIFVVISPVLNNGSIELTLVTAQIGPAPAPDSLVERIQTELDERAAPALQNWLNANFYLETLTIADGMMTLGGTKP